MSDNENPWDDAAFKTRIKVAAKRKGLSQAQALLRAGASRSYLDKSGETRTVSTILRLAQTLDVAPAYLFGLQECPEKIEQKTDNGIIKSDRDKQLTLFTKLIAAQLGTLIYLISDNSDDKAKMLMKFVMNIIDHAANNSDFGGNSQ